MTEIATAEVPSEFAAPLDLLLTSAALGPARRFLPGGSGRCAWPARWPGVRTGWPAGSADSPGNWRGSRSGHPRWRPPHGTGGSPTRRGRRIRCCAGSCRPTSRPGRPSRGWCRTSRWTGGTPSGCGSRGEPRRGGVAEQQPVDQPGGVEGGDRHRRRQRGHRVRGNLLGDLASAPRVPSMVEPDAYRVGQDLAVTPGSVVLRTPVFELIQYRPQTPTVRTLPVLVVPPTINKFYILDLAPGRSLVEYLVQQGQQVFVVSWRNPDARHSTWGLDTYVQAILEALDAVEDIGGVDRTHLRRVLRRHPRQHGGGAPGRHRAAGPAGQPGPAGDHARPVPGRADRGADRRADRGPGRRRLPAQGLPGRPLAGRGLRLAAARRPRLELLGQQLHPGQEAAEVRHPLLERRHHADDRESCTGSSSTSPCTTGSSARVA